MSFVEQINLLPTSARTSPTTVPSLHMHAKGNEHTVIYGKGHYVHIPQEEVDVCCLSHEPAAAEERDYLSACDTRSGVKNEDHEVRLYNISQRNPEIHQIFQRIPQGFFCHVKTSTTIRCSAMHHPNL